MADSRLWAFLRPNLQKHGFTEAGGQAKLRALLATKGIDVSPQAIHLWTRGGGMELKTLLALLDLLDMHGAERTTAIDICAGREVVVSDSPEAA